MNTLQRFTLKVKLRKTEKELRETKRELALAYDTIKVLQYKVDHVTNWTETKLDELIQIIPTEDIRKK